MLTTHRKVRHLIMYYYFCHPFYHTKLFLSTNYTSNHKSKKATYCTAHTSMHKQTFFPVKHILTLFYIMAAASFVKYKKREDKNFLLRSFILLKNMIQNTMSQRITYSNNNISIYFSCNIKIKRCTPHARLLLNH